MKYSKMEFFFQLYFHTYTGMMTRFGMNPLKKLSIIGSMRLVQKNYYRYIKLKFYSNAMPLSIQTPSLSLYLGRDIRLVIGVDTSLRMRMRYIYLKWATNEPLITT